MGSTNNTNHFNYKNSHAGGSDSVYHGGNSGVYHNNNYQNFHRNNKAGSNQSYGSVQQLNNNQLNQGWQGSNQVSSKRGNGKNDDGKKK